jgi:hypothetical protein
MKHASPHAANPSRDDATNDTTGGFLLAVVAGFLGGLLAPKGVSLIYICHPLVYSWQRLLTHRLTLHVLVRSAALDVRRIRVGSAARAAGHTGRVLKSKTAPASRTPCFATYTYTVTVTYHYGAFIAS